MKKYPSRVLLLSFFVGLLWCGSAAASVTMTGTRIIYNGAAKSTDIQLKNKDRFPYVISTWFDDGHIDNGPEQGSSVPFIATPPVFRIQPEGGQIVRVVYTGARALPQDRESLFYFNFMQMPPANVAGDASGERQNGILVMLRNRIKFFYRPAGIEGDPQKMLQNLQVHAVPRQGKTSISVTNNQPYHVTVSAVHLTDNASIRAQETDTIIPPFGQQDFLLSGKARSVDKGVRITLINDQGARISENYPL
ncbi:fimbria/pilus periplasmic chaperone [Klebsiella oxytoca]|nr:fimbria/pilus periplasmic chaperone [Klebsiella oxytoca]